MQNVRTLGKASSLPSRPAPDARQRSLSLQAGHISSRWWKRSASIATIGYVLFSQTLHAVEGWSRLGVAFAGLLVFILVLGRATGVWSFKNEKWLWVPAPFLFYCLIRAFPEAGNDWPVEQLFPLICAFSGGIGTALALQVAVPFRAVVYAQVASNLCNIAAALIGVGTDAPSGMDEVRYAGVTGNANAFGLQLALGGCLIWLLPKAGNQTGQWFC